MGIPRFYRWLSERYPLISENITADQIPEFDNLYLDMNGIIHNCSHNNTGGLVFTDEGEVFVEAFKYIVRLFHMIRPKKVIYMCVDGCAPRAKMNQQRSRRFRAANDAREAREKAAEMGDPVHARHFDSNCITPGTEFMAKLTEHLRFFVMKKIQEDPLWQQVTVIVSGPDVPGEGEHKIMDYIRTFKAQPGYNPHTRHCLYGLDADLIMLALASHEPHFALLREEVIFGNRATETPDQRVITAKDKFQLLHVSLLREYLDLEFGLAQAQPPAFPFNLERLIDDFVLFCVLVGNDFLPCLPMAEIGEGGLDDFFAAYKEHLKDSHPDPWLTRNCGEINFEQLALFIQRYANKEENRLASSVEQGQWILGSRRLVGPKDVPDPVDLLPNEPVEPVFTTEEARLLYYDVKFRMDLDTHEGTQQQRQLFQSYLEGLQWVLYYYYRGPDASSWSWYYPYYYAPMATDLANFDELTRPTIQFDVGAPFRPFQQLMAVLPSVSKVFLPQCYQWLFDSPGSPILHFYPQKFQVDMDGVKVSWGGMTLIPWISPAQLLDAMKIAEQQGPALTEAEKRRNQFGVAKAFRFERGLSTMVKSSMPRRFADLPRCSVRVVDFAHPPLPPGTAHFPNEVPRDFKLKGSGFPTLHLHPLTYKFELGVQVFQAQARNPSMILNLHAKGPLHPSEQSIQSLLQTPCAQIDFPMVHKGKIVAVHTTHTKYYPNGSTKPNNLADHENKTWEMLQEWRKKGVTLDFDGASAGDAAAGRGGQPGYSEEELWRQPLVEIKVAESSYIDSEGRTAYRFKGSSEFRLFHLVWPHEMPPSQGPRSLLDRFPVGTPVVCILPEREVFGQVGSIYSASEDQALLEALVEKGFTSEEQDQLQEGVLWQVKREVQGLQWHNFSTVCREAQLPEHLVQQLFRSVIFRWARGEGTAREDIGMNFIVEPRGEGPILSMPCYSIAEQGVWWFSDLALQALKDYRDTFPEILQAISHRRDPNRDLEARMVYPETPDLDYTARKVVKYCNSQPFKKLRLAPGLWMAVTSQTVAEITAIVDEATSRLHGRPKKVESVFGYKSLYKAEDAGSRPPQELYEGFVNVGQRGIYVKPNGLIPCGAKGTVIGVYTSGPHAQAQQDLEILLDEESFGATDLNGRTPPMRGIQIPNSSFLPLFPRIGGDGELKQRPQTQAVPSQPITREHSAAEAPVGDVLNRAGSAILNMLRSPNQGPSLEPPPPPPESFDLGQWLAPPSDRDVDLGQAQWGWQQSGPGQPPARVDHSMGPGRCAAPPPPANTSVPAGPGREAGLNILQRLLSHEEVPPSYASASSAPNGYHGHPNGIHGPANGYLGRFQEPAPRASFLDELRGDVGAPPGLPGPYNQQPVPGPPAGPNIAHSAFNVQLHALPKAEPAPPRRAEGPAQGHQGQGEEEVDWNKLFGDLLRVKK